MSYLSFTSSTYTSGKSVGESTNTNCTQGNALIDKSVKFVEIPSSYENEDVVEIGRCAFANTSIEKVFIPKTIQFISDVAFGVCYSLNEVRFEKGSGLKKVGFHIFSYDDSLTKIDFPQSFNELSRPNRDPIFFFVDYLECVSYLGSTDFSNVVMFSNTPTIHVSDSNYPKDKQFAQKDVVRDGKTCGVSNDPFPPPRTKRLCNCTVLIRKYYPNLSSITVLLIS